MGSGGGLVGRLVGSGILLVERQVDYSGDFDRLFSSETLAV